MDRFRTGQDRTRNDDGMRHGIGKPCGYLVDAFEHLIQFACDALENRAGFRDRVCEAQRRYPVIGDLGRVVLQLVDHMRPALSVAHDKAACG